MAAATSCAQSSVAVRRFWVKQSAQHAGRPIRPARRDRDAVCRSTRSVAGLRQRGSHTSSSTSNLSNACPVLITVVMISISSGSSVTKVRSTLGTTTTRERESKWWPHQLRSVKRQCLRVEHCKERIRTAAIHDERVTWGRRRRVCSQRCYWTLDRARAKWQ